MDECLRYSNLASTVYQHLRFSSSLVDEKEIYLFLLCISLITSEVEHFFPHMFISHLSFLSHELTSLLLKGRMSLQGLAREKMLQ